MNLLQGWPVVEEIREEPPGEEPMTPTSKFDSVEGEEAMTKRPVMAGEEEIGGELEEPVYYPKRRRKGVAVVIAVIILAAAAVLAWFQFFRKPAETKVAQQAPREQVAEEKPGVPAESTQPAGTAIPERVAQAKATTQLGVRVLSAVFEALPEGAKLNFFSYSDGEFRMELLLPSRELLGQFGVNVEKKFPQLTYKVFSEQPRFLGGERVWQIWLKGDLGSSLSPLEIVPGQRVSYTEFLQGLKAMGQENGVRVSVIPSAQLVQEGDLSKRLFTVNLYGEDSKVQAFIEKLFETYANVSFARLSLRASRGWSLSDRTVYGELDIDLYTL